MADHALLVGIDGSSNSDRAVTHAVALVRSGAARCLHLLNVQPSRADQRSARDNALQSAQAQCAAASVASQSHMDAGQPAAVIVAAADRLGCDAIVVGMRGQTGLAGALMGSVAQDVVARGTKPVWLVK